MRLVCPCCGATASAEAWAQDGAIRDAVAAIVGLPGPVQAELFGYLALFRPRQRALSWPRARTVVGELARLVAAGTIEWQRRPPRPCAPKLWAQGMADMAGRKGGYKSHFTNHNYLRAIVYELADQADAEAERRTEKKRQALRRRDEPEEADGPMPEDVRRMIDATKQKLGIR